MSISSSTHSGSHIFAIADVHQLMSALSFRKHFNNGSTACLSPIFPNASAARSRTTSFGSFCKRSISWHVTLSSPISPSFSISSFLIVGAEKISDAESAKISYDLSKKIQDEMTYPGQIKITVIRETRAINYAK